MDNDFLSIRVQIKMKIITGSNFFIFSVVKLV
jgi:hypothetical protein